jgi:N6-L-threonylcarbamoyladenine synthase
MPLLAFETSCDETSAAVVHQNRILSSVVSSQISLHAEYGGVVPELAAREHLRNLVPIARAALQEAGICARNVEAVCATQGPGLPSALMVGLKAAQALAFILRRPFVGVHHHEAHLYSPWITGSPPTADFSNFQANVSLIVSGGHTMLVHVSQDMQTQLLGSTLDDAAGECFDKTGKLMGLPYPAGPIIDKLAEHGNPSAFKFPRPLMNQPDHDFSFSGLKTSVRYFLRDRPEILNERRQIQDLCASVQAAIVEVLVTKTIRAARRAGVRCVTASGGVACNRSLRSQLSAACAREGLSARLAEPRYCTDNAAMIGILAERKLMTSAQSMSLNGDIIPNWALQDADSRMPA